MTFRTIKRIPIRENEYSTGLGPDPPLRGHGLPDVKTEGGRIQPILPHENGFVIKYTRVILLQ